MLKTKLIAPLVLWAVDDAWQWLGYARKDVALKALKSNFEEGVDFSTKKRKTSSGGRPSDYISLTVECLKAFGMADHR